MLAQHERPTSPLHAVTQLASSSPAAQLPRPDTVKAGLTPKRPRRQVENDEYAAFVHRILNAYARRDGDVEALVLMTTWPTRSTQP
jgi:carotenoid cleavage dioxygenase-like enzyme